MRNVSISILPEQDLTVVTLTGVIGTDDFIETRKFSKYGTTSKVLWDMTGADVSNLHRHSMTEIAMAYRSFDPVSATRGAAIVVADRDAMRTMRLYTIISTHQMGRRVPQMLTMNMDDAHAWLNKMASESAA